MHIVLDLQACQSPESRRRGIGRYSLSLAKAMVEQNRGHKITVFLNGALRDSVEYLRAQFDGLVAQERIVLWDGLEPSAHIYPNNVFRRSASELIREESLNALAPDVVHVASLFEGLADNVIGRIQPGESYLNAVTLYDLIPLSHRETYLAHEPVERWYMEKLASLQRADHLLGISRFSCEEAMELLSFPEQKLTDISGAADEIFRPLDSLESFRKSLMERFGLVRPFVMYAGGFDSRKNIAALIRAFAQLPAPIRQTHQLAIVGGAPAPEKEALQRVASEAGLAGSEVVFAGYVSDDDLVRLYNICALYAFPSLQEGFGLPALEAMSSGAVVIGSNTSSLPEVIGFPEALFDPTSEQAIADKMAIGLMDQGFRERFLAHARVQTGRFSWAESAAKALTALEDAQARWSRPQAAALAAPRRLRQAVIPAPGGDIVRNLPGASVYADKGCVGVRSKRRRAALLSDASRFDRVVADIADHPYCARTLELAARVPLDLAVSSPTIGRPLAAWAAEASGREQVAALVYRAGGYPALQRVIAGKFSEESLAADVPPAALDRLVASQVVAIDGYDRLPLTGWRDHTQALARKLGKLDGADAASHAEWARIARSVARIADADSERPSVWHVDISNLAVHDAGTGIQRVVRHVLDELMASPPEGCRVEPVRLGDDGLFRYARAYTSKRYLGGEAFIPDEVVEFVPGDVYLGLDLVAHLVPAFVDKFQKLRDLGVGIYFVVYDLLPVLRPDCFEPHLLPLFRRWYESIGEMADGVLCISRAVADEFQQWLQQSRPERLRPLNIGWFHLGADLAVASHTPLADATEDAPLAVLGDAPTFLMVGTVEPRKGHAQAIDAFERLWADGVEANLLIVGKPGWSVESLIERLRAHPMSGKRLFWLERAGDDLLVAAYVRASALLMPSEGEGFGLPLIEAAHHNVPLIVRDLPVFREIAGDNAFYFGGYDGRSLAQAVAEWLALDSQGKAPASTGMPWLTWAECTRQLVDVIRSQSWLHRWMPGSMRLLGAHDYRFQAKVGRLVRGRMKANGKAGLLLYGPYMALPAGRYAVEIHGDGEGLRWMDVCSAMGARIHAYRDAGSLTRGVSGETGFVLDLDTDVTDLEIRIGVQSGATFELSHIVIRPPQNGPSVESAACGMG